LISSPHLSAGSLGLADSRDPAALLAPLAGLAELRSELSLGSAGSFQFDGQRHDLPRISLGGPAAGHDLIRIGIFAGLHGDEPEGCSAAVRFACELLMAPCRLAGFELTIYPVTNPVGYQRGSRINHGGKDLNREFWRSSAQPEVRILEAELAARQFHGIISLHTDDTCEGVYGYTQGHTLNEALLKPALEAAAAFLPRDQRAVIDGFAASEGLICDCFQGVLSAPPRQTPQPFDLIFETPGRAPFDLQVDATVAALTSIIRTYPGFIAYAQDL
jgi:protein MpaA